MVEELFPASVAFVGQVDMDNRVAAGLDGFSNQHHAGLCGGAAAFFDIAFQTCADDITPYRQSAQSAGDYMVQGQLRRGEAFAAVLAVVAVAGEQVAAVEFDGFVRDAVVAQQPDHTRHGNMEVDSGYPVVLVGFKGASCFAQLDPVV